MNIRKEHSPCYQCEKRTVGCHSQCEDWKNLQERMAVYEENEARNKEVDFYYRDKQYKSERGIRAKQWKIRGKM